jgi:uncharacterized protein YbjT (DUF2867 family)
MRVILFGATGMVGQGVLRECLLDPGVERVLAVGRTATPQREEKLHDLVVANFLDFSAVERELSGYDACFFCLGITSAGMTEADYRRVTYDIALAAAQTLVRINPEMTFVFVSGAGADSTGRGRVMWARVKGQTENALLALPFKGVYVFRPAAIQPLHGIRSKTAWINAAYAVVGPLYPVFKRLVPDYVTTTEQVGRAMLAVARRGAPTRVLENADINRL